MVEKLFFQSGEFCSEHEVWKLNVAHVFFMQETKFKDAIRYDDDDDDDVDRPSNLLMTLLHRYYDPIVKRLQQTLLDITAIVLGEHDDKT